MNSAIKLLGWALTCALLFLGCQRDEFALKVFADKSLVGAEVLIDGTKAGVLERGGNSDAYFSKWLSREQHRLEVKTGSRTVYDETISIRAGESEFYVHVTAQPAR